VAELLRELILVRHGEPTHIRDGLTGGWTDSGLTDLGRRQARATGCRVGELVSGRAFGFYSSDLRRARETAELMAESLHVTPRLKPGLREFNNGEAANLTEEGAKRIQSPWPEGRDMDWAPYPGSETWRTMAQRVAACMSAIAEEAGHTVVIVSHGGAGQIVILWWLGLVERIEDTPVAFDLDPCSITRLTINRWDERTISKLNDTAHLAGLDE
jgi:broad specificity phosphatase PhoE